jgi:hypothetical protein
LATRLAQAGAEINSIAEFPAENTISENGSASATISSTKAKTGTYSMAFGTSTKGRGLTIPATTQIRGGFYLNHNGVTGAISSARAYILMLAPSGGSAHYVGWNPFSNVIEMFVNGVQVATYSPSGALSATNTWFHIGFTFKAHASTGYFTLYVDGVAILTYSGNTTNTNGIIGVLVGGHSGANTTWNATMYADDLYVDDDSGGSDVAPSSPRFLWSLANGAGTTTQWTPLSSTNISNVDDADGSAPDDDSTYNSASAAGLTDTFNTTNITVPAGLQIAAAIPVAWAKKTNAGVASTIDLIAYNGSTTTGSPKTPGTSYGPVWDRFVTDPSSAAWTQTSFNAAEFGYKSDGSY